MSIEGLASLLVAGLLAAVGAWWRAGHLGLLVGGLLPAAGLLVLGTLLVGVART